MIRSVDFEDTPQTQEIQTPKTYRFTKVAEERFNTYSHFLGGILSVIGLFFLLKQTHGNWIQSIVCLIYGFSNIFLFFASSFCHSQKIHEDDFMIWSILDQIAIYLMIAGTYTPIVFFYLDGFWKFAILIGQWGFAAVGIIVKLTKAKAPKWITAGIYLVQGWMLLFALNDLIQTVPGPLLIMIFCGGLFYSIGATFYVTNKPKLFPGVFGAHELWHIFVMIGAGFFYFVVFATL